MSFWNDERIAAMREMIEGGKTASDVAVTLGCTRNAVIGKATREGIRFGKSVVVGGEIIDKRLVSKGKAPKDRSNFIWSPRAVARLSELALAGESSVSVARKLSHEFVRDVSDKAVRAAAVCRGIPFRSRQMGASVRQEAAPQPIEIIVEAPTTGVTLLDLTARMCRWPIGEPRDIENFRYCGAARKGESSYCSSHHALAYAPSMSRRRTPDESKEAQRQIALKIREIQQSYS